jgi:hypothetical protein
MHSQTRAMRAMRVAFAMAIAGVTGFVAKLNMVNFMVGGTLVHLCVPPTFDSSGTNSNGTNANGLSCRTSQWFLRAVHPAIKV